MKHFAGNIEQPAYAMEWRVCERFPSYEVSEYGDLRRRTAIKNRPLGFLVRGYISPAGYVTYSLTKLDGDKTVVAAHILVAEAFLPPRPTDKHEVAHRSGSKKSAYWRDLRWATKTENNSDKAVHGTWHSGHANGRAKLTDEQALHIRSRYQAIDRSVPRNVYGVVKQMAAEYGVCVATIHQIGTGRSWRHLPFEAN